MVEWSFTGAARGAFSVGSARTGFTGDGEGSLVDPSQCVSGALPGERAVAGGHGVKRRAGLKKAAPGDCPVRMI